MSNPESTAIVKREEFVSALAEATSLDANMLLVAMDTVGKGLTQPEFAFFVTVAARSGLDILNRQVYAIKRYDSKLKRDVMAIQTAIDGFRAIADRSGDYLGQEGPLWCGPDGQWVDVWLSDNDPVAAKVGVYKRGSDRPIWGVAKWREFAALGADGKPEFMWRKMPDHMLAKCAEAQALRKAFPVQMAGIRAEEEATRQEWAENSPEAEIARRRDETPLTIPAPASKRFHTDQGREVTVYEPTGADDVELAPPAGTVPFEAPIPPEVFVEALMSADITDLGENRAAEFARAQGRLRAAGLADAEMKLLCLRLHQLAGGPNVAPGTYLRDIMDGRLIVALAEADDATLRALAGKEG